MSLHNPSIVRGIRKILGAALTTSLVVAALVLAGWFVYSKITGATLVHFRTGSMAPTMPQGTVAVTVEVSADDLAIGDVITVQRAGEPDPVTHRIIEIGAVKDTAVYAADIRAAAPGNGPPDLASAQARQIVMQGDDNDVPDHLPYVIDDARKVLVSVPGLGNALMLLQAPASRLAMILLVGALVTWAFWPQRQAVDTNEATDKASEH